MKLIELKIYRAKDSEQVTSRNIRLYYAVNGEVQIGDLTLNEGELLAVNPNEEHRVVCRKGIAAAFEISWYRILQLTGYQRKVVVCNTHNSKSANAERLRRCADRLLRSLLDPEYNLLQKEQDSLELVFCLMSDYSNNVFAQNEDTRKTEIEAYIEAHYTDDLCLEEIADEFGLTPQYFSKYFREAFGTTFLKYLNHLRLEYAADDLTGSDETLLRIAVNNGFPNTASFLREFRNAYGMTPSEYRKENRIEKQKEDSLMLYRELVSQPEEKEDAVVREVIHAGDEYEKLNPYWTEILNAHTFTSFMKNGMSDQLRLLHDSLKFRKVRIQLDTYSEDGRHHFFTADTVVEFFVSLKMDLIIVIDLRTIDDTAEYLKYFREQCRRFANRFGTGILEHAVFEISYNTVFDQKKLDACRSFCKEVKAILRSCRFDDRLLGPSVLIQEDGENFRKFVKAVKEISVFTVSCAPYAFQKKGEEVFINRLTDAGYVLSQYQTALNILKEEGREEAELIPVSWKDRLNDVDVLNETPYAGTRIIRTVLSCYGILPALPLDMPLDLMFDEMIYDHEFNLLPGILTNRGIRKPSFHALKLLDQQDEYVCTKHENLLITHARDEGFYQILCHNGKKLSYRYYAHETMDDPSLYVPDLFEDTDPLGFEIQFTGLSAGKYLLKSRRISEHDGFAFGKYMEMKYFSESLIGKGEAEYLRASSVLPVEGEVLQVKKDGRLLLKFSLEANEIRHLHLIKMTD